MWRHGPGTDADSRMLMSNRYATQVWLPVELPDDQKGRVARERVQQARESAGGARMRALSLGRRAPVRPLADVPPPHGGSCRLRHRVAMQRLRTLAGNASHCCIRVCRCRRSDIHQRRGCLGMRSSYHSSWLSTCWDGHNDRIRKYEHVLYFTIHGRCA